MHRMKRRMKRSQRAFAIGIALAAILGWIGSARAQDYPSRPITMIVPYPAGGLFDAGKWWPIIKAANIKAE